ncbi:MAG: response regulator [Myxococcales bacterium]|nr:response regulator [Myxococcales bacterium]
MARVLIVDDNEGVRRVCARVLVRAGFEVLLCEGGAEAIEAAEREEFDLALVDLNLPGVKGTELLERLFETCAQMRGVLASGGFLADGPMVLPDSGRTVSAMCKPFDAHRLVDAIQSELGAA